MAETIGRAYVRILADGSGLRDQIERDLRENEGAFAAAGDKDSKTYQKALAEGFKGPALVKLREALNKGMAEGDLADNFFNSDNWINFEKDMQKRFGPEIGRRLHTGIEEGFRESGDLEGITKVLEHITPEVAKVTKQIVNEENKIAAEFEATFKKSMNEIDRDLSRTIKSISRDFDDAGRSFDRTNDLLIRGFHGVQTEGKKGLKALKDFENAIDESGRAADRNGNFFTRLSGTIAKTGSVISKGFGRGSRNNFLNFIGVVTNNVFQLIALMGKGVGAILDFFTGFAKGIGKAADETVSHADRMITAAEELGLTVGKGGLATAFGTLASGGLNLVAALGVLVGALTLAAITAGILVSGLSLLAGILTALAASIAFAVGSLAALAPLVIPLAGIIAGIVLTIKEFKDATGPLKSSLDKVKTSAVHLKDVFADAAFHDADKTVDRINKQLKKTEPLIRAAGRGFRGFVDEIVTGLENPAWDHFRATFETFLPNAMTQMGTIFSNVLLGISGVLDALSPSAQRFLNWLEKITGQFAAWATSAQGRKDIEDFMNRAIESAKALGGFLGGALDLITSLLSPGKDTGDTIWENMGDKLTEWSNWIDTHGPEVTRWFEDAKTTASELGGAIEGIAAAFDKLDTEDNRKAFNLLVGVLVTIVGHIALVISTLQKLNHFGVQVANGLWNAFKAIVRPILLIGLDIVDGFVNAFQLILRVVRTTVDGILGAMAHIPGPIGNAAEAAKRHFDTFADGAEADLNNVEDEVDSLRSATENPMALRLDTAAAESAVRALNTSIANMFNFWSTHQPAPRSPTAVEHGVTRGGGGGGGGGGSNQPPPRTPGVGQRTTAGVNINVFSATKDPAAVANETVNRLVAVGFAS